MTTLMQLKVDKELKARADELFNALGLDTPTALRMFLSAAVREQAMPIKLVIKDSIESKKASNKKKKDAFFSKENIDFIKESIKQIEQGNVVKKSIKELTHA